MQPESLQETDSQSASSRVSTHGEREDPQTFDEQPAASEYVRKLKKDIETLRRQVQQLKNEKKVSEEREQKRGKLYAEFLRWAPKVQHEGWLTNKVRKAYAACQKLAEALERGG